MRAREDNLIKLGIESVIFQNVHLPCVQKMWRTLVVYIFLARNDKVIALALKKASPFGTRNKFKYAFTYIWDTERVFWDPRLS